MAEKVVFYNAKARKQINQTVKRVRNFPPPPVGGSNVGVGRPERWPYLFAFTRPGGIPGRTESATQIQPGSAPVDVWRTVTSTDPFTITNTDTYELIAYNWALADVSGEVWVGLDLHFYGIYVVTWEECPPEE